MSGEQFMYAFVEKSHRKACQQVLHNVFSLLFILQPPAGQNNVCLIKELWIACFSLFLRSHLLSNYWWPKKRGHFIPRHAHSPAVFEQPTPFPHIPFVHYTFTIYFKICLWISTGWTFLAFKNRITDHTSQVAVLSCSSLKRLGGEKILLCTTRYTCPP